MTCIPFEHLAARRAAGLSPAGGPVPDSQLAPLEIAAPDTMTSAERAQRMDALLSVAWEHPQDQRIFTALSRLLNQDFAPAVISGAADHLRALSQGPSPDKASMIIKSDRQSYLRLAAAAQDAFGGLRQLPLGFRA